MFNGLEKTMVRSILIFKSWAENEILFFFGILFSLYLLSSFLLKKIVALPIFRK